MKTLAFYILLILAAAGLFGVLIWAAVSRAKDQDRIGSKNAKREAERQRKLLRKIEHQALEELRINSSIFAQQVLDDIENDRRNKEMGR